MKINKWTQVLLGAGLVSIPAVTHAEEQLSQLRTELTSTTISGYVDTTATWKFGSGNANMPGRVYDGTDTQDGFNLNVVSITFAKPLDESEWAAGYNVQTLFGPGASKRGTGSLRSGVDTSVLPDGINDRSAGDVAFNEAVVLLRVPVGNGIDFKVGQFGTYNGYEAYDTYKNPNWSRSYGFYIESSAHTGVSATYKVCDTVTVMGGVGNMAAFNNAVDAKYSPAISESEKAYLGMITFTAPESFGASRGPASPSATPVALQPPRRGGCRKTITRA
ncbi:MAG: outer membrane beta-barrel protein [Verrucomicrobiota bacterium]